MNKPAEHGQARTKDAIQERLAQYACSLDYQTLPPEVIHAAKARIIDTLGALVGGFFNEPSRLARNVAAQMPNADGSTVIGTRLKTTPDLAAFVNATTARHTELTDSYHWPGSAHGHPSDAIASILAAAEHVQASGRDFIASVVLSYEAFLRISDVFRNPGFDNTNFACIGTALAAGKLFGLSPEQASHCISMAVVPNAILKRVRRGDRSMFKAAAAGQAGRAGVFAALLARAGMEGPHLPFEGKAGWCEHVAGGHFTLDSMGGNGTPYKILDTLIKIRPSCGEASSAILAAEKVAPIRNIKNVKRIVVETFKYAKDIAGTGEHRWNPTREDADGSIPFTVAAALMDGTLTVKSYNDAHISNPELHALMQKIEVAENDDFTNAFDRVPQEHRGRVTIEFDNGERLVGDAGGDQDDMSSVKTDEQINDKFRGLAEEVLGTRRVKDILQLLWNLDDVQNVASVPPAFLIA